MRGDRIWTGVLILGGLLALTTAFFGIWVGGFEDEEWGSTTERVAFVVFALVGAALLVAGLYVSRRSIRLGAGLIILGAVVCGFITWWTIAGAFVALAVVVLTIIWMRRPSVAVE